MDSISVFIYLGSCNLGYFRLPVIRLINVPLLVLVGCLTNVIKFKDWSYWIVWNRVVTVTRLCILLPDQPLLCYSETLDQPTPDHKTLGPTNSRICAKSYIQWRVWFKFRTKTNSRRFVQNNSFMMVRGLQFHCKLFFGFLPYM